MAAALNDWNENLFQAGVIATKDNPEEQQQSEYPQSSDESSIIRWNATTRTAHIAGLLPAAIPTSVANSTTTVLKASPFRIYLQVAAFLAMEHFNKRDATLVPQLQQEEIQDCDLQLTMEFLDTNFSPLVASRKLMEAIYHQRGNSRPMAFVGAARSAVSQTTSLLSGIHDIPQVSSSSTSAVLDYPHSSPYFGRTIPINDGDAQAIVAYLTQYLGIQKLGVLFVNDVYGTEFSNSIDRSARASGARPTMVSYASNGESSSVRSAIEQIRQSSVKYIFAILSSSTWTGVVELAVDAGITGNQEHVWIFSESAASFLQAAFTIEDQESRDKVLQALQGAGFIELYLSSPPALEDAYEEFLQQPSKQQHYWSILDDQEYVQQQFRFSESPPPLPLPGFYSLTYDAVMALGLAACQTDEEFFTGPQLYQSFINASFHGASGEVHFDSQTGTRSVQGLNYAILNFIREQDDDNIATFRSEISSILKFDAGDSNSTSIQIVSPFVYWDGSTTPPAQFPPLVVNMTLISTPVMVVGLVFCGIAMMMSIGWAIFTFQFRHRSVIVIAQPPFLYMTCIGTFIMAASIIPMSFQEPLSQSILDFGCMAQLWTLAIGFTTVFSALFCKMWRVNQVFGGAQRFRRVKVEMKDVMYPFVLLLSLNVVVLLNWTLIDPLVWTRSALDSVDRFGRPNVSVGRCSSESYTTQVVFYSVYFVVNLVAVVIAIHQSYVAREHPTEYKESGHVALTMGCLLEEAIVGLPVAIFLSGNDTEAYFLIVSVLVSLVCVSVLLPTFIPKYTSRNEARRRLEGSRRRVSMVVPSLSRQSGVRCLSEEGTFDFSPLDSAPLTTGRVGAAKHVEMFRFSFNTLEGVRNLAPQIA